MLRRIVFKDFVVNGKQVNESMRTLIFIRLVNCSFHYNFCFPSWRNFHLLLCLLHVLVVSSYVMVLSVVSWTYTSVTALEQTTSVDNSGNCVPASSVKMMQW